MNKALEVFHSSTSPQVPQELADFAPPLPLLLALLARLRGSSGQRWGAVSFGTSPCSLPPLPWAVWWCGRSWVPSGRCTVLRPGLFTISLALLSPVLGRGPTSVSPSSVLSGRSVFSTAIIATRSGILSVVSALSPLSPGVIAFFIATAGSTIFPIFVLPGSVVLPGPPLAPVRPLAAVSVSTAVSLAIFFSILPALCAGDPAGRPPCFLWLFPISVCISTTSVSFVLFLASSVVVAVTAVSVISMLLRISGPFVLTITWLPFSIAWATSASTISFSFRVASTLAFALPG